jgi:hypothetical protein
MTDTAKQTHDIPPAFWAAFQGEFTHQFVNPENTLERITTYADRKTYENWDAGVFIVAFADGRVEKHENVQFNANDILAAVSRIEAEKETEA